MAKPPMPLEVGIPKIKPPTLDFVSTDLNAGTKQKDRHAKCSCILKRFQKVGTCVATMQGMGSGK